MCYHVYVYDLPVWATGFLWNGKQCAAYYGEHDGIREVVLGFDLRESDFALQPEFPVFMNHALHYLEDSSLLSQNVYDAGDTVQFHALNGVDVQQIAAAISPRHSPAASSSARIRCFICVSPLD